MNINFFKKMMPIDSIIDMLKKSIISNIETSKKEHNCNACYFSVTVKGVETVGLKNGKHESFGVNENYASVIFDSQMMDMINMVKMSSMIEDTNRAISHFFDSEIGKDSLLIVYISNGEILAKFKNSKSEVKDIDFIEPLKIALKEKMSMS